MKIPWGKPKFWGREKVYLNQAFDSTWLSGGQFVERFETQFAALHGAREAVAVANGTASLFLAFKVLNLGPGDEVIIPGYGFIAVLNMVLEVGATPIFCDVDAKTMLLDATKLEAKLTPRTKAIVPIHTYGNVCDMPKIRAIADGAKVAVIEDVAEALFSKIEGRFAGTFSEVSSFSFQSTKTITTGEGGMLLTNSVQMAEKLRSLRSHGAGKKKYWHEGVAYNFRLTNLQAAIGLAQLEKRQDICLARQDLYFRFKRELANLPGIEQQTFLPNVNPVPWAFALTLSSSHALSRDQAMAQLEALGIETRPGFYTAHDLPAYHAEKLSVSQHIAEQTLTVPFYPGLTGEELTYLWTTIRQVLCPS